MPALLRAHMDGELDLPASGRRSFRDQLRNDVPRLRKRGHEHQRNE
jgi:hypothetical protein